jgi:hypothetical protein
MGALPREGQGASVEGSIREGLNNSRFRLRTAENTGDLADCRLKLRINQTFLRRIVLVRRAQSRIEQATLENELRNLEDITQWKINQPPDC